MKSQGKGNRVLCYKETKEKLEWESKLGVVWESGVEGTQGGQLTLKAIVEASKTYTYIKGI